MKGKKGVILGVANERSMAYDIAKGLHAAGAEIIYSYLPDAPGKDRNLRKLEDLTKDLSPAALVAVDVNRYEDLEKLRTLLGERFGKIDFILHSIAYAPIEEMRHGTLLKSSKAGFLTSMDSSVYSLVDTTKALEPILADGAAIVTMSYLGAVRALSGYNLMGLAKASLEAAVRYLACELGPRGIRVNAISAGMKKTLSSSVIAGINDGLKASADASPLGRNITGEDLSGAGLFLMSPLSSGVTGHILYVDCGVNISAIKKDDGGQK